MREVQETGSESAEGTKGNQMAPEKEQLSGSAASIKRTRRSPMFTSTPEIAPPQLLCPNCDLPLVYRQTVISGVKPIERWDYFECRTCGPFVYRDRTRKLRATT
jgi:hypothetical protein